jgi:hypothetical protein
LTPYRKDSSIYYSAEADSVDSPEFTPAPRLRQNNLFGELVNRFAQRISDIVSHKIRSATVAKPPVTAKPPRPKPKKPRLVPLPFILPNPVPSAPQWVDRSGKPVPVDQVGYKNGNVNTPVKITVTYNPKAQAYEQTSEPITRVVAPVTKSSGIYVMSKTGKNALSNVGVFRGTNKTSVRHAPAAISRRINVVNKPHMTLSTKGIVVKHKEYMTNIISSATTLGFNSYGVTLNPGKISAFPWLSTIAGNFDKYRILSCTISLVTNQPTTTAGRIGVGFDYDSTDPLPADRTDFFSLTHHAECAAWDSLEFKIPLQGGVRYVNSHTITDSKLIDYGQVIIMTDQIVTTGTAINLGDAIIEYTVELIDPQQAIMSTYLLLGGNSSAFDRMQQVGPVIAEIVPTTSTTVVDHELSIGYYMVVISGYDGGSGTPTASVVYSTGTTGKQNYYTAAAGFNYVGFVHVLKNDTILRVTYGSVAIADLETMVFTVTRIAPPIYVKGTAAVWNASITANL